MKESNYISRVVHIGNVPLGGDFPIRIQSMTTTNSLDTQATVAQAIRMIKAGSEYVRITAQGVKEAENLAIIKKELTKSGYNTPLIADIHYNPKAAETAARIVEKVRINPGNYSDRKKGKPYYSEREYASELDRIRDKIEPLISICKQYGTVIRIGSNHGSLSERILLKYGDTPAGMVESALEFIRICRDFDFHNLVLSMKSSNVKVMVHANRLLVKKMTEEGMDYPIHLGVTEAGDAEDGRIKSAAGIGSLLAEGIGDTIRVSLTEEPEYELPVAKTLVSRYHQDNKRKIINRSSITNPDPISYERRITIPVDNIGNGQVPVVILSTEFPEMELHSFDKDTIPDYLYDSKTNSLNKIRIDGEKLSIKSSSTNIVFIESTGKMAKEPFSFPSNTILVLKTEKDKTLQSLKEFVNFLIIKNIHLPVIFFRDYSGISAEELVVQAATDSSFLLVDGLLDGIWICHNSIDIKNLSRIAYGILQATGSRITKTEYIACPSCGRTLFNIQETLQRIKSRTSHLKGLKIGVMGCCVNGPGEMADADYGYVGAGKGKITLYKGKQIIEAGIPENEAVEALVSLIKSNGDWKQEN